MTSGTGQPPTHRYVHELGVSQPSSGWWQWLQDSHFLTAVVVAVPVWAALGLVAGHRMQPVLTLPALISLVVLQPIVEEILFRGVLQGRLLGRGWTRRIGLVTTANLAATAAFVLPHLLAQPLAWAIAVAAPSIVFGHLRERFDSVLPSIALHAVYNAGFALTAWIVRG